MMNFFHKRMRKDQKGFTLVELLVVVTILGILATLAVQTIGDKTTTARQNKALADLRTVVSALELYKIDNSSYPVDTAGDATDLSGLVGSYLHKLPNVTDYALTADDSQLSVLEITVGSQTADLDDLATNP